MTKHSKNRSPSRVDLNRVQDFAPSHNAGRQGDRSVFDRDIPKRSEVPTGPSITGSSNVLINNLPALRVGDDGIHNNRFWIAAQGAPAVLFNNRRAHRIGDMNVNRNHKGTLAQGSPNVIIGDHFSPNTKFPEIGFVTVEIAKGPLRRRRLPL